MKPLSRALNVKAPAVCDKWGWNADSFSSPNPAMALTSIEKHARGRPTSTPPAPPPTTPADHGLQATPPNERTLTECPHTGPSGSSLHGGGELLMRAPTRRSPLTFLLETLKPSLTLVNSGTVARDHLASERTFLAYVRTSLAVASTGVGVPLSRSSFSNDAGLFVDCSVCQS